MPLDALVVLHLAGRETRKDRPDEAPWNSIGFHDEVASPIPTDANWSFCRLLPSPVGVSPMTCLGHAAGHPIVHSNVPPVRLGLVPLLKEERSFVCPRDPRTCIVTQEKKLFVSKAQRKSGIPETHSMSWCTAVNPMATRIQDLSRHVDDIISFCVNHQSSESALVVFDRRSEVAQLLTVAYRARLPHAKFIDFDEVPPSEIMAAFGALKPSDFVVLIQSSSFRLVAFRIRVELFKRSIKVIEHPHLEEVLPAEVDAYVDSLAYDPTYYRVLGRALQARIADAKTATVDSGDALLVYGSELEPAKLNIGDYTGMRNIGGQFPIGEVFTEAKDLTTVNGRARIFAFGNTRFRLAEAEPMTMVVEKGVVVNVLNSTAEFDEVLEAIRRDEGEVWVRELGFGMNRAFTPNRRVSAVSIYERMCGVHLSLGRKHGVYNKPNFRRKDGKYHVDVFAITKRVLLDDGVIFENGAWLGHR